jgi:hypothetical protein
MSTKEIKQMIDYGQQRDGRFLSLFKLENGNDVKSYHKGDNVDVRMLRDARTLFEAGVSISSIIADTGFPPLYVWMSLPSFSEVTTA